VVIETDLGAATLIAEQAPTALNPNAPESLLVNAPRDPKATKDRVQGDVNQLFLLLGLVSLIVGAIGIANVTLVTVMERTGEIGLRRALGASRRHIALQFLAESVALGVVGGIIGASVGILLVVSVAASRDWTPVLDLWLPLVAPLVGALVGLLAGLYPSIRASRLEPVEALRSGT
jgi:putative ABC transport system permease protein